MIFETHAHYDDEAFDRDRDELLKTMHAHGIEKIINVGASLEGVKDTADLMERYPFVYGAVGIHPDEVGSLTEEDMKWLRSLCDREKTVAVGEIGLDYHYGAEFAEQQKEALRAQLELAGSWDLPVNIHLRDATGDFVEIIEDCRALHLRGNLHAYGGSYETFRRLSRSGDWYIGVGGVVTFRKAAIAEELHRYPLDRILLETDAPYLTPVPHRGERNESSMIPLIASEVARRTGTSLEFIAETTTANAKTLFAL